MCTVFKKVIIIMGYHKIVAKTLLDLNYCGFHAFTVSFRIVEDHF